MSHVVPKEVSAKLVLIKDGKVLVRTFADLKTGEQIYDLPGGRVDTNEQPEAAARLEAMEELGVEVGPLGLVHAEFVGKLIHPTLGLFYYSNEYQVVAVPQVGKDVVDGNVEAIEVSMAIDVLSFDVCKKVVALCL